MSGHNISWRTRSVFKNRCMDRVRTPVTNAAARRRPIKIYIQRRGKREKRQRKDQRRHRPLRDVVIRMDRLQGSSKYNQRQHAQRVALAVECLDATLKLSSNHPKNMDMIKRVLSDCIEIGVPQDHPVVCLAEHVLTMGHRYSVDRSPRTAEPMPSPPSAGDCVLSCEAVIDYIADAVDRRDICDMRSGVDELIRLGWPADDAIVIETERAILTMLNQVPFARSQTGG